MKKTRRFIALALCFVLSSFVGVNASALESFSDQKEITSECQAVIDKINETYGLDYYLPSKEELASVGLANPVIDKANPPSIEQFEAELRKDAEIAVKEKAKVAEAQKAALSRMDTVNADLETVVPARVRLPKSGYKPLVGATAYFEGWANDNNGYWVWEYLNTTSCQMDDTNPTNRFVMTSYSHTFLDSNRTCAVTYNGIMYKWVIFQWVGSNTSQYLEWWAGM